VLWGNFYLRRTVAGLRWCQARRLSASRYCRGPRIPLVRRRSYPWLKSVRWPTTTLVAQINDGDPVIAAAIREHQSKGAERNAEAAHAVPHKEVTNPLPFHVSHEAPSNLISGNLLTSHYIP
jgi:hypothetical protein